MERQFTKEIESLRLGDGETFHGEGILAVTKALLQSGVSYVGGYQGAPVSHLLDVMVQARDYMDELGVHVEACTSEASAAAMLGASINYPARGAVTWKSVVGTNVAADALSYLASAGVMGGTLIVLGEDYGEGGVVAQERSHSFAMKSLMWLLDPRPNLTTIVDMVEHGFALSEASNTPVMMELRIRACHVHGSFIAKDNIAPAVSMRHRLDGPPKEFIYDRLAHPPAIFRQEKLKNDVRLPAARKYIAEHKLNEIFDGDERGIGIVVQGGLYNGLMRALRLLGLADDFGGCRIPIYVLNVVYPLVARRNQFLRKRQNRAAGHRRRPARVHRAGNRHAPAARRPADEAARQGLPADGGRLRHRTDGARPGAVPGAACAAPGSVFRFSLVEFNSKYKGQGRRACSARCPSARRPSASAARSGRCSRR